MARISNPKLFSEEHKISPCALSDAGLIDPFVNVDTPLFIDPLLLEKSSNVLIAKGATEAFRSHFSNFIRLLRLSKSELDPPWKAAARLLDLSEAPANGLGFGGSDRSGSSRPLEIQSAIMRTSKQIIELGSSDPEMISLMSFFEEDVGPDTISDYTTHVIAPQLAEITRDFCQQNAVPIFANTLVPNVPLPQVRSAKGRFRPLLLVPKDIVRDLPLAADWADVDKAVEFNNQFRDDINKHFASYVTATSADRKDFVKKYILSSAKAFEEFLDIMRESADSYDANEDAFSYYRMRDILAGEFKLSLPKKDYDLSRGCDEVVRVGYDALFLFKRHVEEGNLWEELWIGSKPKRERSAQLIFFAMADAFCKANDIDISPEANMGGGPVDFKLSQGYECRVLLEFKRSSGSIKNGYSRQIERYRNAAQACHAIFVIMDYGDLGRKLAAIESVRDDMISRGLVPADIVVINAARKLSASKLS